MIDKLEALVHQAHHDYGLIETVLELIHANPVEMEKINAGCLADLLRLPGDQLSGTLEALGDIVFNLRQDHILISSHLDDIKRIN